MQPLEMGELGREASSAAAMMVAFRGLPFGLWALRQLHGRTATSLVVAGVVVMAWTATVLLNGSDLGLWQATIRAYVCVVAASLILIPITLANDRGLLSQGAVCACALAPFLLVPPLFLSDAGLSLAVVLGWDSGLRAGSFILDNAAHPKSWKSFAAGLWFVVVGPHLVYAHRGVRTSFEESPVRGLTRVATSSVYVAASVVVAGAFPVIVSVVATGSVASALGHTGGLVSLYFAHAGLAGVQIGFMRMLGYEVGERYRRPWLAVGPTDFFRRWNIWLHEWVERYLFRPAVRRRRVGKGRLGAGASLASYVGPFAVVGAMHDAATYVDGVDAPPPHLSLGFTELFVWFGALTFLQVALDRALRRSRVLESPRLYRAARAAMWTAALYALTYVLWPGMSWVGLQ